MAVRRGLGPSPGLICEMLIHLVREIVYLSGKSQGILIQAVPFLQYFDWKDIGSLGREMRTRAISRTVFCFLRVLFTFLDFQESSTVSASPDSSPE